MVFFYLSSLELLRFYLQSSTPALKAMQTELIIICWFADSHYYTQREQIVKWHKVQTKRIVYVTSIWFEVNNDSLKISKKP